MFKNNTAFSLHTAGVLVVLLSLVLVPAIPGEAQSTALNSTPTTMGYINHTYGTAVKAEPTAETVQSKLWWNDGLWWGILFNPTASAYQIYWLDWGTQTWRNTGISVDSRKDDTGLVATRFDVLWDTDEKKLYLASHIKIDNSSEVKQSENWARLYRYAYHPLTRTYSLDDGFPVTINNDKTKALVLEKDSAGRLWVSYVSRVPSSDLNQPAVYHVYLNYTETAGDDRVWAKPINLSTYHSEGATVNIYDIASVIAFGDKVGILWSNGRTGSFYFAEHPAGSAPTSDWNIQAIDLNPYQIFSNDHIKLVANAAGQVFSTVKTMSPALNDPQLGLIARDLDGTFSFHTFSSAGSVDTRPSLLYDDSSNQLIMFATSNEAGGVICYKTMQVTAPLANMAFPLGNCTVSGSGAPHFIVSAQYPNINNSTTSKRNINQDTGIVVLATDDKNGSAYLHNVMGSPRAVVTDTLPAQGETVNPFILSVTLRFSHDMNPATLTGSHFQVIGPSGVLPGVVSYNEATRQVTFTASTRPTSGTHRVMLSSEIRDLNGSSIYHSGSEFEVLRFQVNVIEGKHIFMPLINR